MPETYYFAYGTNLNTNEWTNFCLRSGLDPDCTEALEPAILPDMRLSFDSYSTSRHGRALNIVPAHGQIVEGMLYRVSAEGLKKMNQKAVAPFFYERIERTALCLDGTCVSVITYQITEEWRESFSPLTACQQIIANGIQTKLLPTAALDSASTGNLACPTIETIFVYGTLMRGQPNSKLIPQDLIRSVQRASIKASLYDSGNGFPALTLDDPDAGTVWGELIHAKEMPALLKKLDWLEGFRGYENGSLFHRLLLEVTIEDGQSLRAWCYTAANSYLLQERIYHGCWKKYNS